MILKFFPKQSFISYCLFYCKRFLFYRICKKIECLSNCYTSDETLCLCVEFEKSNCQRFKFKNNIQLAFQLSSAFDELERIF